MFLQARSHVNESVVNPTAGPHCWKVISAENYLNDGETRMF